MPNREKGAGRIWHHAMSLNKFGLVSLAGQAIFWLAVVESFDALLKRKSLSSISSAAALARSLAVPVATGEVLI